MALAIEKGHFASAFGRRRINATPHLDGYETVDVQSYE